MKKTTILVVFSVLAVCLIYTVSFFWLLPKIHNSVLYKFSRDIFSVQLPLLTTQMDNIAKIGTQYGNGNHCDYLAVRALNTSMSKNDFEKYFISNYAGKSKIQFVWLNEPNIYTNKVFDSVEIFTIKDLVNKVSNSNVNVLVYTFETSMTSSFDYRCR